MVFESMRSAINLKPIIDLIPTYVNEHHGLNNDEKISGDDDHIYKIHQLEVKYFNSFVFVLLHPSSAIADRVDFNMLVILLCSGCRRLLFVIVKFRL